MYFSNADLKSSRTKGRAKPVSQDVALKACANALREKYPTAHLHGFRASYDASKSTGNVLEKIGLTVENQFGNRVERVGNCIIPPSGKLDIDDIHLTKR